MACGTSYYAGLVAKYWFEQIARLPVEIDIASEFRYRTPPMEIGGLSLFISQSGETIDTLAALEYAKSQQQHILSIVNVPESSISRASDVTLLTKAGPEIGVASTKAFTTQLVVLGYLTIHVALKRGHIDEAQAMQYRHDIQGAVQGISEALTKEADIEKLAHKVVKAREGFLGIGNRFFKNVIEGGHNHNRYGFINKRDGSMLHLTSGISFGVDVGNLFEL